MNGFILLDIILHFHKCFLVYLCCKNNNIFQADTALKLLSPPFTFLLLIKMKKVGLMSVKRRRQTISVIKNMVNVGVYIEKLLLFTSKGNQLWISSIFKINSPFPHNMLKKDLPYRKKGNPAIEAVGGFDEKFHHGHRSRTGSGGITGRQFVSSLSPGISRLRLSADGWYQLASSAHTSGVLLPKYLPVSVLERELGLWRERHHGGLCFCFPWKTVSDIHLYVHMHFVVKISKSDTFVLLQEMASIWDNRKDNYSSRL